jgi:hypothetical protein
VARPISWNTADLTSSDGTLNLERVRFFVRTGHAYALDARGNRLWEAVTVGDPTMTGRDRVTIHLAEGPDVTARKQRCRCSG